MTVEWQGVLYEVPISEPTRDRDLGKLWAPFRVQLEAYVADAQRYMPAELRLGETRRSLERQIWLYSLGRAQPGKVRSWTLESRHLWGLACDLYAVDHATGEAVWEPELWQAMYAQLDPRGYGLTTIPQESVHLEAVSADVFIARAAELGLVQT